MASLFSHPAAGTNTMCLAIPGQLLDISADAPLFRRGRVAFGALIKEVSLACLPAARVGDYVLVHAGIALSVVDANEAQRVFDLIAALDDADADNESIEANTP